VSISLLFHFVLLWFWPLPLVLSMHTYPQQSNPFPW
jgi:hypothetical protein